MIPINTEPLPKVSISIDGKTLVILVKNMNRWYNPATGKISEVISDLCAQVMVKLKQKALAPSSGTNRFTLTHSQAIAFKQAIMVNLEEMQDPWAANEFRSLAAYIDQKTL